MHENESQSEVAQSCLTRSDPMDCSLPGSSIHGIFQARVLEWGAIVFRYTRPLFISLDLFIPALNAKYHNYYYISHKLLSLDNLYQKYLDCTH